MGGSVGGFIEDLTGIDMGNNSSADRAEQAQRNATNAANATQRQMYDQTRADLSPYREAGLPAISALKSGDFMKNFQGDPGFQFRMQEGLKALQGSAAAKGSLNSGATLKALTRYGQDYASNEYANAYGREFNRLSTLLNAGQNSAAQTGMAGQNYANQFGQNVTGMANAQAGKEMGQANQRSGLVQGGLMALAFCDARLKTDVRPVDPADIAELRAAIKPYYFKYISESYGDGEWVGVMAQDLEKTKLGRLVVSEDEQGRKQVHLQKLLSLLIASFVEEAA